MNNNDQQAAIDDAVEQIGLSMAANAFPLFYVAQNIYDTSESILNVWNARESTDELARVESGIDLVFAVVGWVPVVGAGVKRTFRLVNHKSEIYGPLLFDILRLVLQRAHCPTSPEELVDKLFDASGLKKLLTESREHIEKSWVYREMPPAGQATFSQALGFVETNLPFWLTQFVERKLMHWRKKQPNSSAEGSVALRKETEKPGKVGVEAEQGHNRASSAPSTGVVNAKLAVTDITNKITGLLGEHIADYYCYEHMKWGSGWDAHDQGALGRWANKPSATVPGKLNEGTQLNKLFAPKAHGRGIDGVWRANPANNNGRPFAIVEAKSSRVRRAPKNQDNKPNMVPKLGVATRIVDTVLPRPDELLEPPLDDDGAPPAAPPSQTASGGKKGGRKRGPTRPTSNTPSPSANQTIPASTGTISPASDKIAQMTDLWVWQNLPAAVGGPMTATIRKAGYARHILYIPFYLPSAVQHEEALLLGKEHDHADHHVPLHYTEADVAKAANEKQARLDKKYGVAPR
ncbi:hypothetical protein KTD31_00845 [Burkholderia multivorans]|uniref:hypothetical protein n=1 Tax=Burkholderia multivorans TaxID=87883 RepID=UPI001C247D50|nr:hypothetical protein [Burkholderia multivorans]MBU9199948.1 hypothetical protein [Burkholderia multivorans]MDN8078933.1 hypothetical protein [Burkholderia multivorans]